MAIDSGAGVADSAVADAAVLASSGRLSSLARGPRGGRRSPRPPLRGGRSERGSPRSLRLPRLLRPSARPSGRLSPPRLLRPSERGPRPSGRSVRGSPRERPSRGGRPSRLVFCSTNAGVGTGGGAVGVGAITGAGQTRAPFSSAGNTPLITGVWRLVGSL
jgi:hypothetical protein